MRDSLFRAASGALRPVAVAAAVGLALLVGPAGVTKAWADPPPGSTWHLDWSDEFDGATVDASKWDFWLAGQVRRAATNDPANTFLGDGSLTVRITKATGTLTSGGLQSKLGFGAGYFEVRAKVLGGWATFWLQSPGIDGVGNPAQYGTEMDIQEACCPGAVQHAVHWNGYGADHVYQTHAIGSAIVPNQKDWNVYGLEWTPSAYKFWVNGKLSWTFTTAISARADEKIRLTEETDGDFCGGECLYVVDYVRVYRIGEASDGGPADAASGGRAGAGGAGGSGNAAGGSNAGGGAGGARTELDSGASQHDPGAGGVAAVDTTGAGGQAGGAPDDEPSTNSSAGCGCRSSGSPPAPFALWLVGLAWWLVRSAPRYRATRLRPPA